MLEYPRDRPPIVEVYRTLKDRPGRAYDRGIAGDAKGASSRPQVLGGGEFITNAPSSCKYRNRDYTTSLARYKSEYTWFALHSFRISPLSLSPGHVVTKNFSTSQGHSDLSDDHPANFFDTVMVLIGRWGDRVNSILCLTSEAREGEVAKVAVNYVSSSMPRCKSSLCETAFGGSVVYTHLLELIKSNMDGAPMVENVGEQFDITRDRDRERHEYTRVLSSF